MSNSLGNVRGIPPADQGKFLKSTVSAAEWAVITSDDIVGGGGSGGSTDLEYLGTFVPGNSYNDGDVVIYNGISYMCVRPTTNPPTPWPTTSLGDKNFVYTQATAAASWTVTHNLAKFPAVSVVDSGGTEIIPDVHYIDANSLTITFGNPTSGKAYCN